MARLRLRVEELERENEELRSTGAGVDGGHTRYLDFYENSPIGYFTLSEAGEITEANETIALLLGLEKKVLLGMQFDEFVEETSGDAFLQYLTRLIETGEKRSIEMPLLRKDERPLYGLIEGVLKNRSGCSREICFSLSDITKAKETMDKLEAIYAVLMRGGAGTVGMPHRNIADDEKGFADLPEKGKDARFFDKARDITIDGLKASEEREERTKDVEERIVLNINDLIIPHIEGLRRSNLNAEQKKSLAAIEERLRDIAAPFMQKALSQYVNLTPREIQIAGFIRYGRTTKEIAQIIGISSNAVEIHRASLRNKFNLKHKKANLRSFLLSLSL